MEKTKRKPTAWNLHLMKVYHEMKAKDENTRLPHAMVEARKTY